MKKITLLVLALFSITITFGQTTCPASIKSNSTISQPTFVLSNGQNGCNQVNWPSTILVDNLTYSFVSCSGGNLKYAIDPGQTAPTGYDVTIDYGNGLVCDYDANGDLSGETLSSSDLALEKTSVFPNPVNKSNPLFIGLGNVEPVEIQIIDITGKTVLKRAFVSVSKITLDIDNLHGGLYMLSIQSQTQSLIKKLIIND